MATSGLLSGREGEREIKHTRPQQQQHNNNPTTKSSARSTRKEPLPCSYVFLVFVFGFVLNSARSKESPPKNASKRKQKQFTRARDLKMHVLRRHRCYNDE
jgi:hypothetical protein